MSSEQETSIGAAGRQAKARNTGLFPSRDEITLTWQTEPAARVLRRERARARAADGAPKDFPSAQLVPRESKRLDEESQAEWQAYAWEPETGRPAPRPRGAGVTGFARRLMAIERARARRGTPVEFPARPRRRRPD